MPVVYWIPIGLLVCFLLVAFGCWWRERKFWRDYEQAKRDAAQQAINQLDRL